MLNVEEFRGYINGVLGNIQRDATQVRRFDIIGAPLWLIHFGSQGHWATLSDILRWRSEATREWLAALAVNRLETHFIEEKFGAVECAPKFEPHEVQGSRSWMKSYLSSLHSERLEELTARAQGAP